jgi:hypothetical protein
VSSRRERQLHRRLWQLCFAAPQVVAYRWERIVRAGFSPGRRDGAEFRRMADEKLAAWSESWAAAMAAMARSHQAAWQMAWLPLPAARAARMWFMHAYRAWLAALAGGLAPIHRRVVSNRRRLAQR